MKVSDNIAVKDLILILKFIANSTGQEGSEQGGLQDAQMLPQHSAGCCPYPPALASRKAGEAGRLQEVCLLGLHLAALAGFVPCTCKHRHCAGIGLGNSMPVSSASISHLILGVVKTSPRGGKGKEQIFPSFGLGTFPHEQLTLHSANTFRSLEDFPWAYVICQLIGNFPCFFLSPHKCLSSKELTKPESFLALPCFHHSFFPFPLHQPFSIHYFPSFHSAILVASSQMTKWSYFAVLFIPT